MAAGTRQDSDPVHDVLRTEREPLQAFFSPRNVAVIGATDKPGSVGRTLLRNLVDSPFGGAVFPINPRRPHVLGIKAYPHLAAVPDHVDLAVIATPAPTVPGLIGECVAAGVEAAIVISAGFKEIGPDGLQLERAILDQARGSGLRVIGPNCLGVMRPISGVNATFAAGMAGSGHVALLSQSGAICTAVLDWSFREHIGFSAFISIGSMLDVGWGDLISYLGNDPHTQSIVIYMETIGDARSFLSAAREVALTKPIILLKAGRSEEAARAAASHTGALAGSDEVLDAALCRCGVLRVDSIAELFDMAEVLAKQKRPAGPRLTMVTNAGGPAVLATDALVRAGGKLAELPPAIVDELNAFLPPSWSQANPIDILGDADAGRYVRTLQVVARDPDSDGVLVILAPQAMTNPTQVAEKILPLLKEMNKPVLASWMGGVSVMAGGALLDQSGISAFPYPDAAAKVFHQMWQFSENLRSLFETPSLADHAADDARSGQQVRSILDGVLQRGRTLLTEWESKRVLAACGIPTVETRLAGDEDEAVRQARDLGFPVVVKLHSETITHKTDVGGVELDLPDEAAVRAAYRRIRAAVARRASAADFLGVTVQPMVDLDGYELILGSSIDAQFGPVLLFGAGGQLVEVFRDKSLALPPLNTTLALRMMSRTRIFRALQGVRGRPPVDIEALKQLIVRFSNLVVAHPRIKEMDINPLLAAAGHLTALDVRIVLHEPSLQDDALPRSAIRAYPDQYLSRWVLRDGTPATIRPIRPEDEPLMVRFHETLSERSVYFRYMQMLQLSQRIAHERLSRLCFIDYDRAMALVVERRDPHTGVDAIVAVGRLTKLSPWLAEFAIVIADAYQRQGIGSELLGRLVQVGRDERLRQIRADILPENLGMQRVSEKHGFRLRAEQDGRLIRAELNLA